MSILDQTSDLTYATLSAAISGSSANDVLLVPAGIYVEDFPSITHSLTIDSVGGLAYLSDPQPVPPNGRAVLDVPVDAGINLSISGLEISGAATGTSNANGAGILFEIGNGNLTVTNSWIQGNQEGILTGYTDAASPAGGMNITISHSEIDDNGAPIGSGYAAAGQDHNIYVGNVTSFTITDSYVHSVYSQGSEIKSRAASTTIVDNRIDDVPTLTAGALGSSYDIDIPDGGVAAITGNVIEKGPDSVNRYMVHYAGEGMPYAVNSLLVSGNTFINDRGDGATAVYNQSQDQNPLDTGYLLSIPAAITGNTIYDGNGPVDLFQDEYGPPFDTASNNVFQTSADPALDMSPGFNVPEPASAVVLLFAAIGLAMARGFRFMRGRYQPSEPLTLVLPVMARLDRATRSATSDL